MTKKRKRARPTACSPGVSRKRAKTENEGNGSIPIEHPTLCLYYSRISTLRNFLLASLPPSSRSRRRKISSVGCHQPNAVENAGVDDTLSRAELSRHSASSDQPWPDSEKCLATLLDKTLVCTTEDEPPTVQDSRESDFTSFSQQANLTARSSFEKGISPISEVGKRDSQID